MIHIRFDFNSVRLEVSTQLDSGSVELDSARLGFGSNLTRLGFGSNLTRVLFNSVQLDSVSAQFGSIQSNLTRFQLDLISTRFKLTRFQLSSN